MTRRIGIAAVLVAAALSLHGCARGEIRALEAEVERLRVERDKLAAIAEHLDEYQKEVAKLVGDLERTEQLGAEASHAELIERAGAVTGVTKHQGKTSHGGWRFSGTDSRTLQAVSSTAGYLAVQRLEIDGAGSWAFDVPAYDYESEPPAGIRLEPPRSSLPPPGRFGGRRAANLRSDIEALGKEVTELQKLVGDVAGYERLSARLRRHLEALNRPDRLRIVDRVAGTLREDDGAPCSACAIDVTGQSLRLWCAPRKGLQAEAAAEAIRARFTGEPSSQTSFRVGPLSIDASSRYPIQGTLTPIGG